MAKSDLKTTLMDIRKMRRDVKMRKETDPDVVAKTLETILKEAVALSTTDDGAMSKAAIKELKQIRKGMLAGQIDAGGKTANYIGAFSGVLDQVDEVEKEVTTKKKAEKGSGGSIMDSLPSSDSVISAIMTANPVLGYTMKVGRDIVSGTKRAAQNRREREKEEAQLRRERLQQQEEVLTHQMETDELVRDQAEESGLEPEQVKSGQETLLEAIRDEIKRLTEIVERQDKSIEKISDEGVTQLEQISEETSEQNRLALQSENEKGLMTAERNFESDGPGLSLDMPNGQDGDSGGMFGGLMEGFFGKVTAFFGILAAGAKFLGPIIAKSAVVLGFFKMVYDFFDGFSNAEEILDMEDLNWKDKVKAGISHVLSGLLAPINWITETFFGTDIMGGKSREDWTKQYFEFFDNFADNIIGMAKWIGNSIVDSFSGWMSTGSEFISDLASDAFAPLLELMEKIKNYIRDKITDLVPDFARGWFGMDEAEDTGESGEPKVMTRDDVARKRAKERERLKQEEKKQERLEEEQKQTTNSKATSMSENFDALSAMTGFGSGGAGGSMVVAPTNSVTNVSNAQYTGGGSSENREPAHRRFSNLNNILGAGNL